MHRPSLCIHHFGWPSVAWLCAALLTALVWAPSASCQANYSVKEPPAPQASQAVATLLAENERLQQARQHEEALQTADRALVAALEAVDLPGEALSRSARAASLRALGRKAEAVAAWQAAAGAWERANEGQGQIEPLVSAALDLLAIDGQQARQLLARALRIGKVERQRRFATADTLQRSGMRLQAFESSQLATPEDARAFLSAADALRHEATVGKLLDEDQYAEAEALARHRLTEVEATSGPESLDTADALDVLAGALFVVKTAEIPEKRQLAERALAIREKSLGPVHFEVAQSLYTLGRVLWQAGEYREARLQWERSLAIREKVLGPRHAAVRILLAHLSSVLTEMGDCTAALPLAERFVALQEKAYGPDHPFVGRGTLALFRAHYCAGNYTEARRATERGLAIKVKAWGEDNVSVATDRVNLGQLLLELGDLTEARRNYELALKVFEKVYGPESVPVADSLGGLARVAANSGDHATARGWQERAVRIFEKALGPDHPDLGMPLINLAITLTKTGEQAKAQPLYERALTLWEQSRGSESSFVAVALFQLAGLLQETGELAKARQLYERALAIQEKTYGPNHSTVAATLRGLAQVRAMTGEPDDAFSLALRADEVGRGHWQLIATTLSEREALAYARERASSLDLAMTLLVQKTPQKEPQEKPATQETTRHMWSVVVRSRALVLDEMAARHRTVSSSADPQMAQLAETLTSARERLTRLVVRGPGSEPPEGYHKLLDETRQEKERAERALAERSQTFRAELARAKIGFDDVAAALPSEAALVAYVRYGRHDFSAAKPGSKRPDPVPHYLAFVWNHTQAAPVVVPLGPATGIETLVTRVRHQIAQESRATGRAARRSEVDYRQTGEALRRRVWGPVSPYLRDARRVFIVPDGALHLVNFAALPTGQSSYLLETGPRIHYLSAERDLVPVGEQEKKGVDLLAIGAPAFQEASLFAALRPQKMETQAAAPVLATRASTFRGLQSTCDNFQTMQFEALSASAREASDVAALWRRPGRTLRGAESNAVQLTGAAASESAFKQQAQGKRVLHLATHGFFLGGKCASALGTGEKPGGDTSAPSPGENPLLLSGLALAGANHRQAAGPEEEDGILTAEEIAALDLSGVEWAVLSACDTGIGEVKAGEGVLGLRRAFEVAGARTLILSLWPVEDRAARDWMRQLYRARLILGLTTIDAVHQANLNTLRRRRTSGQSTHPFYWAGFVAAGDWR
jgi:CHAT domain-containing protein/tetratricopeptide (TPR) repeat protein